MLTITATKVMFLDCFQGECAGLLFALPLLAWKQHPFTNDCASGCVFGSHSRSLYLVISAEACILQGYGVIDCNPALICIKAAAGGGAGMCN